MHSFHMYLDITNGWLRIIDFHLQTYSVSKIHCKCNYRELGRRFHCLNVI